MDISPNGFQGEMHGAITATDIENRFSSPEGQAIFPAFCNALIVTAGPSVHSLPSVSEQPGPDGGKDGEWTLDTDIAIARSPFTSAGWNVFQFKSVSLGAKGRDAAISQLERRVDGAIETIACRLVPPRYPSHYTLFTNLQLGLETPTATTTGAQLSTHIEKLRAKIKRASPSSVEVSIVHAATLAALVNKHPALRLAFLSDAVGISWADKEHIERSVSPLAFSVPVVGRDAEIQQLKEWLGNESTKVIAITGASGMGKTRLSLIATEKVAPQIIVIERADRFNETVMGLLSGSTRDTILLVEDPSPERAEQIARYAVAASRIKVILTIPIKHDAPKLRLLGHPAIQTLSLGPLAAEDAAKLLDTAGAPPDHRAREWILLQAGGVPAVLLAAAELKEELREHAGKLREQIGTNFARKLVSRLGNTALETLRLLSSLQWVNTAAASDEVAVLLTLQPARITEHDARCEIPRLEAAGYLRTKGKYVAVVPPVFAATLARQSLDMAPQLIANALSKLGDGARNRFLERVVTLDLPEDDPTWDYFFSSEGPVASVDTIVRNLPLLNFLARAVPRRTLRLLRVHFAAIASSTTVNESDQFAAITTLLPDLLEEPETSVEALQLLETLALKAVSEGVGERATRQFCECFVHWFPLSVPYNIRATMIERLVSVSAADSAHQELGLRALRIATNPPHVLSGRSVYARRLGAAPPRHLRRDVWDFLARMLELRLKLCESANPQLARGAQESVAEALERLSGDLPVTMFLPLLERAVHSHIEGKLGSTDREMRSVLHALQLRWAKARAEPGQDVYATAWSDAFSRLDPLIACFDEAPFSRRLNIAVGRSFAHDYEDVAGERVYGYQRLLRNLAAEVVTSPGLMSSEAWAALLDPESYNALEFVSALAQLDEAHLFLPGLHKRAGDRATARLLATYLATQQNKFPDWVEQSIDDIIASDLPGIVILEVLKFCGPSAKNVERLLALIRQEAILPLELAQTFATGRWLDNLPPQQVAAVFDYMTRSRDTAKWIAGDLALYLHHEKPVPRELFNTARQILTSPTAGADSEAHELDGIALGLAKTDIEVGLELLGQQLEGLAAADAFAQQCWNPVQTFGDRAFWEYLRDNAPEAAYRCLVKFPPSSTLTGYHSRSGRPVLDLVKHHEMLCTLARVDRAATLMLVQVMSPGQPGFFEFAFGLLSLYPNDDAISAALNWATVDRLGWDWDHLNAALGRVRQHASATGLSEIASRWLMDVQRLITEQQQEHRRYFGDDEFLGWD